MTVSSNINVIRITKTTIINDELSTKRKESYPGYQRFFSRVAEPEFSVLAKADTASSEGVNIGIGI